MPMAVLRKSALRPLGLLRLTADTVIGALAALRVLARFRPEAVYVSTVTIPLWCVISRATGRSVICHVHEAESSARAVVRKAIALPALCATQVIINSEFSHAVLVGAIPALKARSTIVSNSVPGPETVSAARSVLVPPIRVLYVGRLSPRKGVDVAVEAVRQLRERGLDIDLEIAGSAFAGYEWYETQLHEAADSPQLAGHVTFHGFTSEVWPLLEAVDIAIVPSRVDEPFGNTAVEALLAARPVVVSSTSGLLEAAGGYAAARFASADDVEDLALAVRDVVENWSTYRDAARADASVAADRHSPVLYRRRVATILNEVVRAR